MSARIVSEVNSLEQSEKIILPGIGHFDYCMNQLKQSPLYPKLQEMVLVNNVPVLGVCVGCQMLMESSEEGVESGLGWIKGKVVRFRNSGFATMKIPHMGWADVRPQNGCALYRNIEEPRFYFVHSYHLQCNDEHNVTATANYGYDFVASVEKNNILGVQFHPEKSHKFGMKLYENFVTQY